MGLILPQTVKVRTSSSNCKHFREKGYEFEKCGDFIEVDVLDLSKSSRAMVKVVCDICGKEREMWYRTVVECNEENKLITCGDKICRYKKVEDTCTKRYGVKNVFQLQETKDKIVGTNNEKYGADWYTQTEEYKDKSKKTCQLHYGVDNPAQAQEVKDAMKDTCRSRYGCDYAVQSDEVQNKIKSTNNEIYGGDSPFSSEEIRKKSQQTWKENYGEDIINPFQVNCVKEKSKQTMLKNHGVKHALQNRELLNKMLDSFQFNSTGPCSRAQKYIHFLIGGTLNKHVCNSLIDICFEEEKTAIEYDGGGHFLGDIINGDVFPTKEALLKEKEREDKIINNGYRMIRFIATKDRIPSDEVILNLIEEFKNSDFKVIKIDFEKGTIEKDYEKKSYCNFGKLRKITKEDLEKFKKQEENTSEN